MDEMKTIMLTTDLSEASRQAIALALLLARKFGAKILLVHVGDLIPDVVPDPPLELHAMENRQRELAGDHLRRFAADHLPKDVEIVRLVVLGVPHVEILRLADVHHPDLIVMAPHGRGFIAHAILGSTTERVLRLTKSPVLVVREPIVNEDGSEEHPPRDRGHRG